MNIDQKRLKRSHIYTNSSKPYNYSEKIISLSPSRKYKNALINLREGFRVVLCNGNFIIYADVFIQVTNPQLFQSSFPQYILQILY